MNSRKKNAVYISSSCISCLLALSCYSVDGCHGGHFVDCALGVNSFALTSPHEVNVTLLYLTSFRHISASVCIRFLSAVQRLCPNRGQL